MKRKEKNLPSDHTWKYTQRLMVIWCEVISCSFLFGAYVGSIGIAFTLFGFLALITYYILNLFYNEVIIVWLLTIFWVLNTLLWGAYIDFLFGTAFIAILLSIIIGTFSFLGNKKIINLL